MKNNTHTVLDFGSGSVDRVKICWQYIDGHRTVRGVLDSRRKIVAHILGCNIDEINSNKDGVHIIAIDPFCIHQEESHDLDGLHIDTVPSSPMSPDILLSFNPPSGVLISGGQYSRYIPELLGIAGRMKIGSKIFVQIDRAYIENFPDTGRIRYDDKVFWDIFCHGMGQKGFHLLHENCLLGLTLDRFGPLESKLFCKTTE